MERGFLEAMLEKAKDVLIKSANDGEAFCPLVAILDTNLILIPNAYRDEEEKRGNLRLVGQYLGKKGISECLAIDDAYFVMPKPEQGNFIQENWDTEKPSLYPPELRREALTFTVVNFKDPAQETIWFAEYTRVGPNIIFTGDIKKQGSDLEVCGRIKDYILEGFLIGIAVNMGTEDSPPPISEFFNYVTTEYPSLGPYIKKLYRR